MISFALKLEGIKLKSSAKMALSKPALVKWDVSTATHSLRFFAVLFHALLGRLGLNRHVFLAAFREFLVDFCFLSCSAFMSVFNLVFRLLALLPAALCLGFCTKPYRECEQYEQNSPHV